MVRFFYCVKIILKINYNFSCLLKKSYKFAKEKQIIMNKELIQIQVSGTLDSENSIGALVDLIFDEEQNCSSASRLVWFPKSISTLEEVDYKRNYYGKCILAKRYFITAPKWFLDKNNINYKIS